MNTKGFTIIETLVAITILMISIVGPMTIAQKSLNAALYAKDQVIATYLAQDKIEYLKAERNAAVDSGNFVGWVNGTHSCTGTPCVLSIENSDYGPYVEDSSGTATKFTREVAVTMVSPGSQEAIIKVTVRWQNGTIENATVLQNRIFDINL